MSDFLIPFPATRQPRDYQSYAAAMTAQYLLDGFTRICVNGPTGCGKTFISKLVAVHKGVRQALGLGNGKIRILYLSHKRRLNRQAVEEYKDVSEYVEIIPHSVFSPLPDDLVEAGWDITFMDECHHEPMMSVQKLLSQIIHKPLIGYTADDQRGDKLLIKFERTVVAITASEAADRGYIEKCGINTIVDTGSTDKTKLGMALMEKYHSYMGNTLVFVRTEREATALHRYMRYTLKLKCAHLKGSDSEDTMDDMLEKLACGDLQFVINCQRIGEGIDSPGVSDVVLLRKFGSASEKKQFIGRSVRPDSPSTVWETINPFEPCVAAKEVAPGVRYERMLFLRKGVWEERFMSGEDKTWGQMGELRLQYVVGEARVEPPKEVPLQAAANDDEKDRKATIEATPVGTNFSLFGGEEEPLRKTG